MATSSDIDEVIDEYCESLDELALKYERSSTEFLRKIRKRAPNMAGDFERELDMLRTQFRFGTSQASYIKTQVIRQIQERYKVSKDD